MQNIILYIILGISGAVLFSVCMPHVINFIKWGFTKNSYIRLGSSSQVRLIHQLYESSKELSASKTGAIITIVNKDSLDNLRTDGIIIDANISSSLIISIFNKKSPLHDGAVIIEDGKIKYAATYYKITQTSVNNKFGARHRAAIGISEQSDAITIIVSEETGGVSIARNGKITQIKLDNFQEELVHILKD